MEFKSPENLSCFKECAAACDAEGFKLVELQIVPQSGITHITVVFASKNPQKDIGVSDCSKIHHTLAPLLLNLLKKNEDQVSMEVCSPGTERNIKNAWEFTVFTGVQVRVWDKNINDWASGVIKTADQNSVTLENEEGEKSYSYIDIAKAKFLHL